MRHTLTLGALAASAALLALPAVTRAGTARQRSPSVRIVAVQYHSRQRAGSLNQQWFQLKNTGRATQMRGRTASNGRGNVCHFGPYMFAGGSYLRGHTGRGHNTTRDFYWGRNASARSSSASTTAAAAASPGATATRVTGGRGETATRATGNRSQDTRRERGARAGANHLHTLPHRMDQGGGDSGQNG